MYFNHRVPFNSSLVIIHSPLITLEQVLDCTIYLQILNSHLGRRTRRVIDVCSYAIILQKY